MSREYFRKNTSNPRTVAKRKRLGICTRVVDSNTNVVSNTDRMLLNG